MSHGFVAFEKQTPSLAPLMPSQSDARSKFDPEPIGSFYL